MGKGGECRWNTPAGQALQITLLPNIFVKKSAMNITKIVEADIADKIDTQYVLDHLKHIDHVGITYICTDDDRNVKDWVDQDGIHIIIKISYHKVKKLEDVRVLMLERAVKRLGKFGMHPAAQWGGGASEQA